MLTKSIKEWKDFIKSFCSLLFLCICSVHIMQQIFICWKLIPVIAVQLILLVLKRLEKYLPVGTQIKIVMWGAMDSIEVKVLFCRNLPSSCMVPWVPPGLTQILKYNKILMWIEITKAFKNARQTCNSVVE